MSRQDELIKLSEKYGKVMNLHHIENVGSCVGFSKKEGKLLDEFLNDCDRLLNMAMDMDSALSRIDSDNKRIDDECDAHKKYRR